MTDSARTPDPQIPASLRIIRGANRTLGRVAPRVVARMNQRLFSTPRRFTPRDWELQFEAMGTRERLPNGASVLIAGDGPRTVVLMHGWEGRATQFAHFVSPLLSTGFRVVGVDGPAHGHARGKNADPYLFAETLHEVSARHGAPFGVIGHSMGGGAIAIALASGLVARRAVVIASPSSMHDVLHRFAHAMHMPSGVTRHFVERLRAQVAGRGHSTVDLPDLLAGVQTAGLVIHARDDKEVPFSDGERLAGAWPGAALFPVDGAGHRRILRDPSVVDAAVAFVSGSTTPDQRF